MFSLFLETTADGFILTKLKSETKGRVLKKLEKMRKFIKDLEKAKKEETTFDANFDKTMRSLEESIKKYTPTNKKEEKTLTEMQRE